MFRAAAQGLIAHAFPILIAQLASIGMMVVDTVVLGHFNSIDLAAVAIGGGIQISVVFALVGVLQAVAPVVAHLHGARRDDEVANVLQQGFWLAVATGKSRKGLDRALAHSGLAELFDITRCADETFSKPHPAMLEQIMDYTGADARRTLMIGDTSHDLLLAKNAGTDAIGVSYGAHPRHELEAHQPVTIADSFAELDTWLSTHA